MDARVLRRHHLRPHYPGGELRAAASALRTWAPCHIKPRTRWPACFGARSRQSSKPPSSATAFCLLCLIGSAVRPPAAGIHRARPALRPPDGFAPLLTARVPSSRVVLRFPAPQIPRPARPPAFVRAFYRSVLSPHPSRAHAPPQGGSTKNKLARVSGARLELHERDLRLDITGTTAAVRPPTKTTPTFTPAHPSLPARLLASIRRTYLHIPSSGAGRPLRSSGARQQFWIHCPWCSLVFRPLFTGSRIVRQNCVDYAPRV